MSRKNDFKPMQVEYAIEHQRTGKRIYKYAIVTTRKQLDKIEEKAIKIYEYKTVYKINGCWITTL